MSTLFPYLAVPLLIVALVLVTVASWRPQKVAMLIAVVVVAGGLGASMSDVVNAVDDRRVEFHGKIDTDAVIDTMHPFRAEGKGDPVKQFERNGMGYLRSGEGEVRTAKASSKTLFLWSAAKLAPWLLALIGLALVLPVLRAIERGDAFGTKAVRWIGGLGILLLLAIPGIVLLQYMADESASVGVFAAPMVSPELTLSFLHVLPGMLLLAFAGVFRQGAELREFERSAI